MSTVKIFIKTIYKKALLIKKNKDVNHKHTKIMAKSTKNRSKHTNKKKHINIDRYENKK